MILITGSSGFVGSALIRKLLAYQIPFRQLIRPSTIKKNRKRKFPSEVVITNLNDKRGLGAAMSGVNTIVHLASTENMGSRAKFVEVDLEISRILLETAKTAGVKRFVFLSHLGADRMSAYPLLKTKAMIESMIINSGINYTILQSGRIFGKHDHYTEAFSKVLRFSPGFFLTPGDGNTLLQPLWIEDLTTCLIKVLVEDQWNNERIQIGGGEHLSLRNILQTIMEVKRSKRFLLGIAPPVLKFFTILIEIFLGGFPLSVYWIDELASDRICSLDSLPKNFGILPSRFKNSLSHLEKKK